MKIEDWLIVLYRWFCGGILCFFGSIPATVFTLSVINIFSHPEQTDFGTFLVVAGSAALTYFFGILVYRAFTGRGRSKDEGLLPPIVMQGFIHCFGIVAILIVIFGVIDREIIPIIGGLLYLSAAYGALAHQKLNTRKNDDA